jgi:hypothetical protein
VPCILGECTGVWFVYGVFLLFVMNNTIGAYIASLNHLCSEFGLWHVLNLSGNNGTYDVSYLLCHSLGVLLNVNYLCSLYDVVKMTDCSSRLIRYNAYHAVRIAIKFLSVTVRNFLSKYFVLNFVIWNTFSFYRFMRLCTSYNVPRSINNSVADIVTGYEMDVSRFEPLRGRDFPGPYRAFLKPT